MSKTLLIVDDNAELRNLLRLSLSDVDFHLIEAEDGLSALELCQITIPHIVILDIMMPRINGYEVIKTIRKDVRMKNTKIIVLTALNDISWIEGADYFMSKPFSPETLVTLIDSI